jgi:hypothetical protein
MQSTSVQVCTIDRMKKAHVPMLKVECFQNIHECTSTNTINSEMFFCFVLLKRLFLLVGDRTRSSGTFSDRNPLGHHHVELNIIRLMLLPPDKDQYWLSVAPKKYLL